MAAITDQEIRAAFESMPEEAFRKWLDERGMALITDTIGLNGESATPMLYVESRWDTPVRERRDILYLGRG